MYTLHVTNYYNSLLNTLIKKQFYMKNNKQNYSIHEMLNNTKDSKDYKVYTMEIMYLLRKSPFSDPKILKLKFVPPFQNYVHKRASIFGTNNCGRQEKIGSSIFGLKKEEQEQVIADAILILNKLTPQKYEKLKNKFIQLHIKDHATLDKIIETLFEYAVKYPSSACVYAKLCCDLMNSKEFLQKFENFGQFEQFKSFELSDGISKFFRKALISRSTHLFQLAFLKNLEKNGDNKKQMIEGNIFFITEIYALNMLSSEFIHQMIYKLFDHIVPKNDKGNMDFTKPVLKSCNELIKIVCKLLTMVGKQMREESEEHIEYFNLYFIIIQYIADCESILCRIKFMCEDVLDLRKSEDWIPRKKVEKPQTLKESKKEFERENAQFKKSLKCKCRYCHIDVLSKKIKYHIEHDCWVECRYCRVEILSKNIRHHIHNDCWVECRHCGVEILPKNIRYHINNDCWRKCQNCHKNIPSKSFKRHARYSCQGDYRRGGGDYRRGGGDYRRGRGNYSRGRRK